MSVCQMFVFHRRNFPNVYNYTHVLCTDLWIRYERIVFIYVKVQVQKINLKCNEMIMMMVMMMMTLMIMMIKIKFKFKIKKSIFKINSTRLDLTHILVVFKN